MWINLTKDIFEKSDFKGLNFLYQILSWNSSTSGKPRYNIVIDIEKVKNTDNFIKLSSIENSLSEFLEIEYSAYVNSATDINYKITSKKNKRNFNIEEAILFFNQPVSIILENSKNDSEFILSIIKHFGKKDGFNKAQQHIDNTWLQFENAGGCTNIPNFIEGFLCQFKEIANKNKRKLSDYFRGIIIIDSDKDYESQSIKGDHKSLLEKLKNSNIDISNVIGDKFGEILNNNPNFHILEKRMMENYLPNEVFKEILRQRAIKENSELKNWLDAYLSLSNKEQLDFINIPDGFPPKENKLDNQNKRKSVDCQILKLYSLSISDSNFIKLDIGFNFKGFDNTGNLNTAKEFKFKNEMPSWFKKEIVNKKNLEERDGINELQRILEKISAKL